MICAESPGVVVCCVPLFHADTTWEARVAEAEMDENDIIIKISNYLRSAGSNSRQFSLEYSAIDTDQKLPIGSTAKYVDQAAEDVGLDIIRKGATMASFRPKPGTLLA
jgi:hypothetical protein